LRISEFTGQEQFEILVVVRRHTAYHQFIIPPLFNEFLFQNSIKDWVDFPYDSLNDDDFPIFYTPGQSISEFLFFVDIYNKDIGLFCFWVDLVIFILYPDRSLVLRVYQKAVPLRAFNHYPILDGKNVFGQSINIPLPDCGLVDQKIS